LLIVHLSEDSRFQKNGKRKLFLSVFTHWKILANKNCRIAAIPNYKY